MKFEKINDNKIKCIIDRHDLETRNINIKELASGSDSAHKFLAEVMAAAGNEVGFFVNGAPLMIEASPMPDGDIAVIITKVGANDELASSMNINITAEAEPLIDESDEPDEAEEIRNALGNFFEFAKNQILNGKKLEGPKVPLGVGARTNNAGANRIPNQAGPMPVRPKPAPMPIAVRTYIFYAKEDMLNGVGALKRIYDGPCEIYLNAKSDNYYLVLHKGLYDTEIFNKVCNIMTEYGAQVRLECANEYYYREHYDLLFEGVASEIEIK